MSSQKKSSRLEGKDLITIGIYTVADQGKTLLVITHDPELVMAGCSYVVHMEKGQVKESYPLDESGSKKVLDFFRIRQ